MFETKKYVSINKICNMLKCANDSLSDNLYIIDSVRIPNKEDIRMAIEDHGELEIKIVMSKGDCNWAPLIHGGSVVYRDPVAGCTWRLDPIKVQYCLNNLHRYSSQIQEEIMYDKFTPTSGRDFLQLCLFGKVIR